MFEMSRRNKDPFGLNRLFNNNVFKDFDNLFNNNLWNETIFETQPFFGSTGVRSFVQDEDGKYVISFEVPGYTKDDIDITLSGTTLKVKASLEKDTTRRQFNYAVNVPESCDLTTIKATLSKGILNVSFDQTTEDQTDKVSIDIEDLD